MSCNTPVVVALDFASELEALNLVAQLDPALCRLKVGKEMLPDHTLSRHSIPARLRAGAEGHETARQTGPRT